MGEVEVQAVGAGGRHLDGEPHLWPARAIGLLERVDVEVGEVAVPDRDEVAERPEVRLQIGHRFTVAADRDGQFGLGAGDQLAVEGHVEPVDARLASTVPAALPAGSRRGR